MTNIRYPAITFIGGLIMILGVYYSKAYPPAYLILIIGIAIFIYGFYFDIK